MKTQIIKLTDNMNEIRFSYEQIKAHNEHFTYDDLDIIFNIAIANPDLFPSINLPPNATVGTYLSHWVSNYQNAYINMSVSKKAMPKTSCSDPAIRQLISIAKNIPIERILVYEKYHNLFMSAENVQGKLLEEYIAVSIRPYGWIWCAGNTLKAIDFCLSDGSFLLQVKNKSNTENSSSISVRQDTTIKKWYRLGTSTKSEKKMPRYRWDILNKIINKNKTSGFHLKPCNMSEEKYIDFLTHIAKFNSDIITEL